MRFVKFFIGVLLLPICVSVTLSLAAIVKPAYGHTTAPFWALIVGFSLWLFLYFALPRPTRTYVLGHELTHALWAWLMGGGVRKLKVSNKGGSVHVTKTNFLITLAPYFFPFYTICVLALYGLISMFFDQRVYEPFWLGCVGLTWSFHLTFTIDMLRQHQPDVQEHGRLFSYAVIYILNVLGIAFWVVMVASPTLEDFVAQLQADYLSTYMGCRDLAVSAWHAAARFWL